METGLVIGGHYLLQRLIKQGPYSTVYQGVDQLFQRMVAVKAVSAAHTPAYRAAVRLTSQFSYPHIVVLYDLVTKADKLYIVQEYIEGNNFAALLQMPLQPYEVVEMGRQICSALIYAISSSRKVCHGDLTPHAILRDRSGRIHVNNFALPSDLAYFSTWNVLGGDEEGEPVADRDLPWGVISPGRQADDARATGLLLYQLLTSHAPGTTFIEPPADGRLRFPRNVPPELCEVVARAVIRRHPQRIVTVEGLYEELKTLAEVLEPTAPVLVSSKAGSLPQTEVKPVPPPGTGMMGNILPGGQPGGGLTTYRNDNNSQMAAMAADESSSDLTVVDSAMPIRPANEYSPVSPAYVPPKIPRQSSSLLWLLLLGLLIFALFFVVGYFAGHLFIPH